ncbi:MAG: hypothetical protein ACXWE0_11050 [Nitrososphaeraceae archaeon]
MQQFTRNLIRRKFRVNFLAFIRCDFFVTRWAFVVALATPFISPINLAAWIMVIIQKPRFFFGVFFGFLCVFACCAV